MKPVLVLRHAASCPLGSIATSLTQAGLDYVQVDLFDEVPRRLPLEDSSGVVVLGGPMSANATDEHRFLVPELAWIREALDRRLPALGVCLGAQLLAKALGAKVYPNARKEIGWFEIELLPAAADDQLFAGSPGVETVFHWHGDTFDLPRGAVHLARSPLCAHQAFRYGPSAYGIQFHLEMTPELMAQWFGDPELHSQIGVHADPEAIRADSPARFPAMDALSQRLLGRFAALCRKHD